MNFEQFLHTVSIEAAHGKHKKWRRGQTLFNMLLTERPSLAEQIRGTDRDPFNCNSIYEPAYKACIDFLKENW